MSFNVLKFIADNNTLSLTEALEKAYNEGLNDNPSGKWEIKDKMWWVCSNCGCRTRMMKKYNVPNYCPACGAKMESKNGQPITDD